MSKNPYENISDPNIKNNHKKLKLYEKKDKSRNLPYMRSQTVKVPKDDLQSYQCFANESITNMN